MTPAPGAVFIRLGSSFAEMTPAEALLVAARLKECAGVALAAQDGRAILGSLGPRRPPAPPGKPRELA